MKKFNWPFMLKSSHAAVRAENYLLRDALKEANAELRKHRILIAGLKNATPEITDKFMKAFSK